VDKQWSATCHLCRAPLSPDDRCIHLWMNELGQVYRVSPSHQFEPEPAVVGKLVMVIDPAVGYVRPDITPPASDAEKGKPKS